MEVCYAARNYSWITVAKTHPFICQRTDMIKVGIVFSISNFFINKMRKKIPSFSNLALWAVSNWIHSYLSTFLPLTEKKVVKTWLKFKFRINNICSTNIAAFLLCLPKIIYYLQIVTVRPHCNTYFLLLLSTQGRRKLPKAGWASTSGPRIAQI